MLKERWKSNLWSIKYVVVMVSLTKLLLLVKAFLVGKYYLESSLFFKYELVFAEISLVAYLVSKGFMLSAIWNYKYIEEARGRGRLKTYINETTSLVFILVTLGLAIILVFSPRDLRLFYILGLPIVLLSSIKVLYTGYLQAQHGFFAGNRGEVLRALIYIFMLISFREKLGIYGLMLVGSLGALAQLYLAYISIGKRGYTYSLELAYGPEVKKFLRDSFLIMLINVIYEASLIWHRENLVTIFLIGIVLNAVATVIYPVLAEDYIRYKLGKYKNLNSFNYNFSRALVGYLNILLVFLTIIYFQSRNLKNLLDLRIENDLNLLFYWGIGIFSISLVPLLVRSLIALEEFRLIYLSIIFGLLVGILIKATRAYTRLVFDSALFAFIILGLIGIDKKTNFLKSREFRFRVGKLVLPIGLVVGSNLGIYLAGKSFNLTIKNQELFYLIMAVIISFLIFIPAYYYSNYKSLREKSREDKKEEVLFK